MKYFTKVAGRDYELDVTPVAGGVSILLDGTRYVVDLAAVEEGGKYSVLVDRRSYSVTVDGDGNKLSLIISGQAFQAEVEDERERAAAGIAGASGPTGGALDLPPGDYEVSWDRQFAVELDIASVSVQPMLRSAIRIGDAHWREQTFSRSSMSSCPGSLLITFIVLLPPVP